MSVKSLRLVIAGVTLLTVASTFAHALPYFTGSKCGPHSTTDCSDCVTGFATTPSGATQCWAYQGASAQIQLQTCIIDTYNPPVIGGGCENTTTNTVQTACTGMQGWFCSGSSSGSTACDVTSCDCDDENSDVTGATFTPNASCVP